ncbi:ABC superfamily ATP binding cassette transporter, ABC domain protein [Clostridioides difficile 6042]|nr:ABC superfamily ATP binding cassette transporter, ABC domain protein [Clostridioides difficile 6042]
MNLLIKTSKQFGKTLVVITHDDRIAKLADRKISIIDGVLMEVK